MLQPRRSLARLAGALATLTLGAAALPAQAWTDWTTATAGQVAGAMNVGGTSVGVTFTGDYLWAQTLPGGASYFSSYPSAYTADGVAHPTSNDMLALMNGGTKTITFSRAVKDPILALVSWNLSTPVTFSGNVTVLKSGCGWFGCGDLSADGKALRMTREGHGLVQLKGTYTSFTFTDSYEYWHGVTVGAAGLATATVPEPSTYALLGSGLLALGALARRRRLGA